MEKIDLRFEYRLGDRTNRLALVAWSDRWVWVDARQLKGGRWTWEWTSEGRLLGSPDDLPLARVIEASLWIDDVEPGGEGAALMSLWRPMLAEGPRALDAT